MKFKKKQPKQAEKRFKPIAPDKLDNDTTTSLKINLNHFERPQQQQWTMVAAVFQSLI